VRKIEAFQGEQCGLCDEDIESDAIDNKPVFVEDRETQQRRSLGLVVVPRRNRRNFRDAR
jgi:hypothetical protein